MKVEMYANTNGRGLWSSEKRETKVNQIKIDPDTLITEGEQSAIYIQAKLDPKTWRSGRDGLVYTDTKWLREFRRGLTELGLSRKLANNVDYTEQGMQGTNYVSLGFYLNKEKDIDAVFDFFEVNKKRFLER